MRRPRPSEPKVRQRLTSDPTPKMSSFMYSSRQTTSQAASGRKTNNDDSPQSRPRPARIGLYIAQRAGLLVFLIVLVVSAINVLRLSSSAEIKPLDTSTKQNYLQPLGTYAAAADKQLAGSILNHNKITVDTTGLSDYLLQKFPELTNVSITMPLLAHRPIIYVEAAQPALLLNTTSGSFIIGNSGKALAKAGSNAAIPDDLPYLSDQSGLRVNISQQVLPSSYVKFIEIVDAELTAKGYKLATFSLPPASTELDAHLTGEAYYVKFNLEDSDPAGEAGTFLALMNSLKQQNITPGQYVDVQVDGRAYYK